MRFGGLGAPELILIVVALALIFGAGKIGDLGGALGKSVREFKKATAADDPETPVAPPVVNTAAPMTSAPVAAATVVEARLPVPEYRPSRTVEGSPGSGGAEPAA